VWVPATLAGTDSAANASNACVSEYNAIGARVFGSEGSAVHVGLDKALEETCGGERFSSCSLQGFEDGGLSEAGKTFGAVVVAHAIAPLLGPRWQAIYRQVAPK